MAPNRRTDCTILRRARRRLRGRAFSSRKAIRLAAFDDLKQIGVDAFSRKHDPYWDIPLVTTLPKPVIDLPTGKAQEDTSGFQLSRTCPNTPRSPGKKRR
jgi:hypothetical protein